MENIVIRENVQIVRNIKRAVWFVYIFFLFFCSFVQSECKIVVIFFFYSFLGNGMAHGIYLSCTAIRSSSLPSNPINVTVIHTRINHGRRSQDANKTNNNNNWAASLMFFVKIIHSVA